MSSRIFSTWNSGVNSRQSTLSCSENMVVKSYGWNDSASKKPSAPASYMALTKSTGFNVRSPQL